MIWSVRSWHAWLRLYTIVLVLYIIETEFRTNFRFRILVRHGRLSEKLISVLGQMSVSDKCHRIDQIRAWLSRGHPNSGTPSKVRSWALVFLVHNYHSLLSISKIFKLHTPIALHTLFTMSRRRGTLIITSNHSEASFIYNMSILWNTFRTTPE